MSEPRCTCVFGPDDVEWDSSCFFHGLDGVAVITVKRKPGGGIEMSQPSPKERRAHREGRSGGASPYQLAKLEDRYVGFVQ